VTTDLLSWPAIGTWLRWRHFRSSVQVLLLFLAAIVIAHGLFGPQSPTSNVAPVLTWVHYRGLLIIGLLAAGNVFCTGCPFVLVRDMGRKLHAPVRRWPKRFRNKLIAVGLLVGVFFVYELFDLWALPRATAILVLSYFAAALLVDLTFSGATFCKYLCPVGQFNFVASTLSPLELRVRKESTCRTCTTADCIKGRLHVPISGPELLTVARPLSSLPLPRTQNPLPSTQNPTGSLQHPAPSTQNPVWQRGCELGLFLPMKVGNLDCTFCMDCVHACPHDNIALAPRVPGAELADARRRSGIGRLVNRTDIALLAIVFTFGALLNAFAMVRPVYRLEAWLARGLGVTSEAPVLALLFFVALVVLPALLIGGAASVTRLIARGSTSIRRIAARYVFSLVPFGVGMWLAHYGFHLLTGAFAVIPIAQGAAAALFGWPVLGTTLGRSPGLRPGTVFPFEIGSILLGAMGSLAVAYGISDREYPEQPGPPTAPWATVTLVLTMAAIWILSQPMEMRGTGFLG
jgi:ferredoxin